MLSPESQKVTQPKYFPTIFLNSVTKHNVVNRLYKILCSQLTEKLCIWKGLVWVNVT